MNLKLCALLLVTVSSLFVSEAFSAEITLDETKQYGPGDIVELSGILEGGVEGDFVALEVKSPSGETIVIRTVTLGPGGSYYLKFKIPQSSETGSYSISLKGAEPGAVSASSPTSGSGDGGCLIATATFGSELAPQVQQLRELRDNTLLQTNSGTSFMTGFNTIYYSFSPTIADWERENLVFKEAIKLTITPLLTSLSLLNYVEIDSDQEVLGYGIGIILLNLGMYFVAPAILIYSIKKRFMKN